MLWGHHLRWLFFSLFDPSSTRRSLICRGIYSIFIQVSTLAEASSDPDFEGFSHFSYRFFPSHLRNTSKSFSLTHLQQTSGIRLHKSFPSASPVFYTQFPPKPPEEALNDSNFGLQCSEHPHLSTDSLSHNLNHGGLSLPLICLTSQIGLC